MAALVALTGSAPEASAEPREIRISRATGAIRLDGDLSDEGWAGATVVDTFFEISPGDNVAPPVRTTARVAYDDAFLYIAFDCEDPDIGKLRAPFADRDVVNHGDFVQVFLDARNDRRSAIDFRVNPRGIQADAVFVEAISDEDFSPDFRWEAATRIGPKGWTAELRIPFSSLRYEGSAPVFAIGLGREYPRDQLHDIQSNRVPRGSTCLLCHLDTLTGLAGLPTRTHLLVVPYVTGEQHARPSDPNDPTSRTVNEPLRADAGVDVKLGLGGAATLDGTWNPDFSQVESDEAQLAVNSRFALLYPEKRPFFLEGIDLYSSPIPAVYTRTITSPRWGLRGTGKLGSSTYTLFVAEDRGGGSVIVPGPVSSTFAPQDFSSLVMLGRLRQEFGRSFAGFLVTGREIQGGGHNWVFGPDLSFRPSTADVVAGQVLLTNTQTPLRPDLHADWDGRRFSSRGLDLSWTHSTASWGWYLQYTDMGDGFRADDGFVPQIGYRQGFATVRYRLYSEGLITRLRPFVNAVYAADADGKTLARSITPGLNFEGAGSLSGVLEIHPKESARSGDTLLEATYGRLFFELYPSAVLYGVALEARIGQDFDYVNARVGHGGRLAPILNLHPTERLELRANGDLQWLDVDRADGTSGRLFTAGTIRLKATYHFAPGISLRLIGQLTHVDRDPSLYLASVPGREGDFLGTALFTYRLNWQTVLFLGYGDSRLLTEQNDLVRTDRQLFLKISYAFQR